MKSNLPHRLSPGIVIRRTSLLVLLALAAMAACLPACNTTEGVGKDMKSVGKGIEETASDAK